MPISAFIFFLVARRAAVRLGGPIGLRPQWKRIIEAVGRRFNVFVKIQQTGFLLPIEEMDETLQKAAEEACRQLKYDYEMMPSGAIHDVAVVAAQKRSDGSSISGGLLFIPCKDGLSHNPKEYASPEAIQKGAMVLAKAIYKIAQ